MHFGQNNDTIRYTMLDNTDNYVQVTSVSEEKDFGITFEPSLKFNINIKKTVLIKLREF